MIEVIKTGYISKISCKNCGAILRYNSKTDVTRENFFNGHISYIVCPECKQRVVITNTRS